MKSNNFNTEPLNKKELESINGGIADLAIAGIIFGISAIIGYFWKKSSN